MVSMDKNNSQQKELGDSNSSKQAWAAAKNILDFHKSSSPSTILDNLGRPISNPSLVADRFNEYFIEKVKILRAETDNLPKVDPVSRLKSWLTSSDKAPPTFKLQPISIPKLKIAIKKNEMG